MGSSLSTVPLRPSGASEGDCVALWDKRLAGNRLVGHTANGCKGRTAEKVEVLKSSIEDGHLRKASTSIEIQGTADLSLIRSFGNDHPPPPQMAAPDLNIRFTPGFGGFWFRAKSTTPWLIWKEQILWIDFSLEQLATFWSRVFVVPIRQVVVP